MTRTSSRRKGLVWAWVAAALPAFAVPAFAASTAVRSFAVPWYTPNQPALVRIQVTADAGVAAWAVEDAPPAGWTISNISDNGSWDDVNKMVKWLFLDGQSRALSYYATPPTGEAGARTFSGRVSFNGTSAVVGGANLLVEASSLQFTLAAGVEGGNGTLALDPPGGTYTAGQVVTLTAAPDNGYRVAAWTGTNNDGSRQNTNAVTMNGNRTVAVRFEPIPTVYYTLTTAVTGSHGSLSPPSGSTYPAGTQVPLTATPDPGYRVLRWTNTDNDASRDNTNTVTLTADRFVFVQFEAIPPQAYRLTTAVDGGHGTLSPQSQDFAAGTRVTLVASPDAGYRVAAWTGTDNDASTAAVNYVTMNSAATVTVRFEPSQAVTSYTLLITVLGGNGVVSPSGGTFLAGQVVTLTAVPNAGYQVAAWTGTDNDSSKAATNAVTMNTNRAVVIQFEPVPGAQYGLAASVVGGHGTVSPTVGTYSAGTVVTLTASPETGYRVAAWTGTDNDASKAGTNTVTMNASRVVLVQFEPVPVTSYAMTASVVGGHGTVSPTVGTYSAGAVVTLTASPETGYRVAAWTGTDNDASKADTNTVTMSTDRAVTVSFEAIPAQPVPPTDPTPDPVPTDGSTPPPCGACGTGVVEATAMMLFGLCLMRFIAGIPASAARAHGSKTIRESHSP